MAVTRTGSVTKISSSANSGSQSVTVPSDAEIMLVGVGNAPPDATANYMSGNPPTLAGNPTTLRRDDDGNGNAICQCIFSYTSPPTGSQTLAWDWSGILGPLLGSYIWIAFYKGIDTTTPIGATGGAQDADNSATTGSITATSGDAVFAICSAYNPTSINWTNATEIDDGQFNGLTGSSAETFPSGNVTLTGTQSGGTPVGTTISAVVIKQATSSPVSIAMDTAIMLANGINFSVVPGAVSKALNTASLTAGGGNITVSPGSVSIALSTSIAQVIGQAITISPGAVAILLSTSLINAVGAALTVVPGARSVTLNTALVTVSGQAINLQIGYIIALDTATITSNGQVLAVVPGVVATALQTATITANGVSVVLVPGAITKTLQSASITAGGQVLDVISGAVIVPLDTATVQADGRSISFSMGGVSVLLDTAALIANGQAMDIGELVATIRAWTLRERDTSFTLSDRDTDFSLRARDTDWSIDER